MRIRQKYTKKNQKSPSDLNYFTFIIIGAGGRLKAHGSTLASFVMKTIAKDKYDDTNPREAILRHAEAAKNDPKWVSHAYKS